MKRFTDLFELQDADKARWLSMEGLRGIAVALVFMVHYSSLVAPYVRGPGPDPAGEIWWLTGLHEIGNSGVDLFFVLSGFLIYKACIHKPMSVRRYAYRRVERIYPTFLAVLAVYIALMLLAPGMSKLPVAIGEKIVYVTSNVLLLPGIFDIKPIITVAWSLSYEALYYILVPVAVVGLAMRRWSASQRIVFILGIYAVMIGLQAMDVPHKFRLSMFIGGIVLYEFAYHLRRGARPQSWGHSADLVVLAALAAALSCFTLLGTNRWMIADTPLTALPAFYKFVILNVVFTILVYRCLFADGLASAVFAWAPLRWLGNMSYSYYLFHSLALQVFFGALSRLWPVPEGDPMAFLYLLPPAFAASVALTVPLYLFIERPYSLVPGRNPRAGDGRAVLAAQGGGVESNESRPSSP
ncbi:MAG: acyltransferase [Alphaproteobacteria bacterium]